MISNLESPSDNSFKNLNENEVFALIFPQTFDAIGMQDDLYEKNLDYLYLLNNQKSKNIQKINTSVEKNNSQSQTENESSILDDFELFYRKFANLKEEDNLNSDNSDNSGINNPFFSPNFNYETKLVYSYVEDEKIIKVEINNQIFKDNKITNVETDNEKSKDNNIANKANNKIITFKIQEELIKGKEKGKKIKNNKALFKNNIPSKSKSPNQKTIGGRRKKNIYEIDINDKYFPFIKGRGLIYASNEKDELISQEINNLNDSSDLDNQNINCKNENNEKKTNSKNKGENNEEKQENKMDDEFSNYNEQLNNLTDNFLYKFQTKKYFVDEKGKKRKIKRKRKFKSDDIRKKIKSRFHKTIKNIINDNLKKAGSKQLFDFFPQCFIGNVAKNLNSKILDLTYKELLSTNFLELVNENYPKRKIDLNKYERNLKVLDYLEKIPDISKRSGFDLIKDKKYKDILKIYFTSSQFENSLIKLKNEKESPEYIQEYIKKAKNYIKFYSDNGGCKDKKEIEINEENEKESKS